MAIAPCLPVRPPLRSRLRRRNICLCAGWSSCAPWLPRSRSEGCLPVIAFGLNHRCAAVSIPSEVIASATTFVLSTTNRVRMMPKGSYKSALLPKRLPSQTRFRRANSPPMAKEKFTTEAQKRRFDAVAAEDTRWTQGDFARVSAQAFFRPIQKGLRADARDTSPRPLRNHRVPRVEILLLCVSVPLW